MLDFNLGHSATHDIEDHDKMTIHHATTKAAASRGFILSMPDEDSVEAHHVELNRRVALDTEGFGSDTEAAKEAWANLRDILDYEQEHPAIRIEQQDGDFVGYDDVRGTPEQNGGIGFLEIARDPDLADLFETIGEHLATEAEGDGAELNEDDDEPTGSVVPAKYKAEYAARGNPNHCGDWLAEQLASLTRILDDKGREVTDLDRLEAIANANDVAPARYGKLGIETNGWQGRFRMTIRNMLTPRVAAKGFLFVPEGSGRDTNTELNAPPGWIAGHTKKAKPQKDARPEAAVQKNPGAGKPSRARAPRGSKKAGEAGLEAANAAIKAAKAKGNL